MGGRDPRLAVAPRGGRALESHVDQRRRHPIDALKLPVVASPLRSRGATLDRGQARPSGLRERPAVHLQPRARAQAVLGPRCLQGSPVGRPTRKGGGFYGFSLDAAVYTTTAPPSGVLDPHGARRGGSIVPALLHKARYGIDPTVCIANRGYDLTLFYETCESRGPHTTDWGEHPECAVLLVRL